jgi:hypothetical protein
VAARSEWRGDRTAASRRSLPPFWPAGDASSPPRSTGGSKVGMA